MYYIKWNRSPGVISYDFFTDDESGRPWSNNLSKAKLFHSEKDAMERLRNRNDWWVDRVTVGYIHPLNISGT